MEAVITWITTHPELAIVALDIIAGWLPDKYTKYPGILATIGKKMYYNGKEEVPPEAKQQEDLVRRAIRAELAKYAKPRV